MVIYPIVEALWRFVRVEPPRMHKHKRKATPLLLLFMVCGALKADGQTPSASFQGTDALVPPGHSNHGGAFNEGPRQRAYLMKGMPQIDFPITTNSQLAQKFFNQGVAQLHGFWYFESERSFRQAAAIDPDCAMAYWGMAMSNVNNEKRAREFAANAAKRKPKITWRESQWIDSLDRYFKEDGRSQNDRKKQYAKDLEEIVKQFPKDIEAKAFYALQLWENNFGMSKEEREKCENLLNEVLAVNPMHPCHHYRIHLFNYNDDAKALNSAARCGQSGPGIAHLWHMPGHTYSQLKRYSDAAWQQEASARTDHAQMMRDRVMPDQIHNFAHNNEWLIRDLVNIGRVHDAIDLAKNMIELPRHPKYNSLKTGGSSPLGRQRLLETLLKFEMWDDIIRLSNTVYLEPTEIENHQASRFHALSLAYFNKGDVANAEAQSKALNEVRIKLKNQQAEAADKAAEEAKKKNEPEAKIEEARKEAGRYLEFDIERIDKDAAELRAYSVLASGDKAQARKLFDEVSGIPKDRLARIYLALGDKEKAETLAKEAYTNATNEVQPLANYVDLLHRCGKEAEAIDRFKELREISEEINLEAPCFRRLAPLAQSLNLSGDWRAEPKPRADVGERPNLDRLGPFRWQPTPAPSWTLRDSNGKQVSLGDFKGKPVLVFFFLGSGCEHCVEQLNLFAPMYPDFKNAGIAMAAVSLDTVEGLKKTFKVSGRETTGFPFPLASDERLDVFKKYRAYDDFEQTPMHGTFLVDGKGLVRWQDISYEPFRETKFLLDEAKRLLAQDPPTASHARSHHRSAKVTRNQDPDTATLDTAGNKAQYR